MHKSLLIVLSLVLVLTLTGLGCKKKITEQNQNQSNEQSNQTTAKEDLTTVTPSDYEATLSGNLQIASNKAKEWKSDSQLYGLSVKLPKNLEVNNATQTYTFGSVLDNSNWWTLSLSEKTGKYVRAIIPKEDYLGNVLKPLSMDHWKSNYIEAFQLAEANGGSEFRSANKDLEINLTLSMGEPKGWLWWIVEYKTTSGDSLKIRINPWDQTIVDESGEVVGSQ